MPGYCVVLNCKNKYSTSEEISFHKFPYNKQQLLLKWIKFTGRDENWTPSRWSSICSRHFVTTDFRKHKSRRCLRPGALPTIPPRKEIDNCTINDDDLIQPYSTSISEQSEKQQLISNVQNIDCPTKYYLSVPNHDNNVDLNMDKSCIKSNFSNILYCQPIYPKITNNQILNLNDEIVNLNIQSSIIQPNLITIENKHTILNKKILSESPPVTTEIETSFCQTSTEKEIVCTLCGEIYLIQNPPQLTPPLDSSDCNIRLEMINKCFSSMNLTMQNNNNINITKICTECCNKLKQFSDFVDIVLKNQQNLDNSKQLNRPPDEKRKVINAEKSTANLNLKIKLEPNTSSNMNIKVKQEISENGFVTSSLPNNNRDSKVGRNNTTQDHSPSDEPIDQKSSQIFNVPILNMNVQQMVNNCDVMEIISLDDGFIELLDDDGNQEEEKMKAQTKIERNDIRGDEEWLKERLKMIYVDHNYSKLTNNDYKRENIENELLVTENLNISTVNENITEISNNICSQYTCCDCGINFIYELDLMAHVHLQHNDNENLESTVECAKSRVTSIQRKYTCTICSKNFLSQLSLNNHCKYSCRITQKQRIFKCRYCQMEIDKWIKMRQHEKECGFQKRFNKKNAKVKQQQPICHEILDNNSNEVFMVMESSQSTDNSIDQFHNEYIDFNNSNDCSNMSIELRKDDEYSPKNLIAPREIEESIIYNDHQYIKNDKLKVATKRSKKTNKAVRVTEKRVFPCPDCSKVFMANKNLKQHMVLHNDYRRQCPECDKTFKHLSGLNQHKRAFHLKLKPHECLICNRKFALKADMNRCRHSDRRLRHLNICTTDDLSEISILN